MKLRAIYLLMVIICSAIVSTQNVNAQTVVVQNNNGTSTASDNENPNIKYINGISSAEDIGGVETTISGKQLHPNHSSVGLVIFRNYQPFIVTVNYEIIYQNYNVEKQTGSLVIPSGETREVLVPRTVPDQIQEVYTITRKL